MKNIRGGRQPELRHPVRALVAAGAALLIGAAVSALSSSTPGATFARIFLGSAALLVGPFTVAGVVHVRARRRLADRDRLSGPAGADREP